MYITCIYKSAEKPNRDFTHIMLAWILDKAHKITRKHLNWHSSSLSLNCTDVKKKSTIWYLHEPKKYKRLKITLQPLLNLNVLSADIYISGLFVHFTLCFKLVSPQECSCGQSGPCIWSAVKTVRHKHYTVSLWGVHRGISRVFCPYRCKIEPITTLSLCMHATINYTLYDVKLIHMNY